MIGFDFVCCLNFSFYCLIGRFKICSLDMLIKIIFFCLNSGDHCCLLC